MRRMVSLGSAVLLVLAFLPLAAGAQDQKQPAITTTNFKVGDIAPDFTLPSDLTRVGVAQQFPGQEERDSGVLRAGFYRWLNEGTPGLSG